MIRGIVGINASEPLKSVELLESATSYELGSPRSALVWYFGSLYPIFVPGDADLVARRADDAAREYEKILSHRDLMIGDTRSAWVHYCLARAYEVDVLRLPLLWRSRAHHFHRHHHPFVFVLHYVAMKDEAADNLRIRERDDEFGLPGLPFCIGGTRKVSRNRSNWVGAPFTSVTRKRV